MTKAKVEKQNKTLKPINKMIKKELQEECAKQRALLYRAAATMRKLENDIDFYSGIAKSAELYIIYLLDCLDIVNDAELPINKEELTNILNTKELVWKESDDKKKIFLKIEDRKGDTNENKNNRGENAYGSTEGTI